MSNFISKSTGEDVKKIVDNIFGTSIQETFEDEKWSPAEVEEICFNSETVLGY